MLPTKNIPLFIIITSILVNKKATLLLIAQKIGTLIMKEKINPRRIITWNIKSCEESRHVAVVEGEIPFVRHPKTVSP